MVGSFAGFPSADAGFSAFLGAGGDDDFDPVSLDFASARFGTGASFLAVSTALVFSGPLA